MGSLGRRLGVAWGSLGVTWCHLGGPKAPRASPLAFGVDSTAGGGGGTDKVASVRLQGGLKEASVRPQGGKGARAGPAYEVLRTTKRSSEDLTRRWARGPANLKIRQVRGNVST